ncbi:DNA helicase [Tanacetum coccineum]
MEEFPEITVADRADIVVRVFEQKVHESLNHFTFYFVYLILTSFNVHVAVLYTIEFQKRGLPHCHTLLWVKDKIQHAREVDQYISAELPNPKTYPEGYRVVSEMMVHGPCGPTHTDAVCMKEDIYVTRRGADLDNSNIVPNNRDLCLIFHAYINVEYYGWSMLIKYLFKYISKGTDRIYAKVTKPVGQLPPQPEATTIKVDEIHNFIDGRYICPHEACWRILKFDKHSRYPTVQILRVHQENMQSITFRDHDPLNLIANDEGKKKTNLTEWLAYNDTHTDGNHLTKVVKHRDIRTVRKVIHITFRAACEALDPTKLWNKYWRKMSDDVPKTTSENLHIPNLYMNDPELKGSVLYEIQIILNGYSKTLQDFGLPSLSERLLHELRNKEFMEEKSYNRVELAEEVNILKPKLNTAQREIYNWVINVAARDQQVLVFVYGHGGIASLLLLAGRTAHSRFKLPLDLTDGSIYRTLKDIMDVPDKLFGGKSVILGGDFCQTLPVKKGGSKAEIIAASIAESHLWNDFKVYTLTENMRLQQQGMNDNQKKLASNFATSLLDVGNGKIGILESDNDLSISWVTILEQYCIPDTENAMANLINFIYDNETLRNPNACDLQQKAIVCPKNSTTDIINSNILSAVKGTSAIFKSSDEAIPIGNDEGEVELLYPTEYLNSLQISGFPPHELELKVGAPIMLLRNVNLHGGLCNRTRMIIKKLWSKLIKA